jgi:hypothetical protein
MAAIYSNGGNRWNILGFNFTKRDAHLVYTAMHAFISDSQQPFALVFDFSALLGGQP